MALAMEHGIEPQNMAVGAMAGVALLLEHATEYAVPAELRTLDWRWLDEGDLERLLRWVWKNQLPSGIEPLVARTAAAKDRLIDLLAD
jgi:hypothetical protein